MILKQNVYAWVSIQRLVMFLAYLRPEYVKYKDIWCCSCLFYEAMEHLVPWRCTMMKLWKTARTCHRNLRKIYETEIVLQRRSILLDTICMEVSSKRRKKMCTWFVKGLQRLPEHLTQCRCTNFKRFLEVHPSAKAWKSPHNYAFWSQRMGLI